MRLIDADKVDFFDYIEPYEVPWAEKCLADMPTVEAILIASGTCKMVAKDYVVYNRQWLKEHLQQEWDILNGKEYEPAIPIEWLEEYMVKWPSLLNAELPGVIEDWKKENGTDRQEQTP